MCLLCTQAGQHRGHYVEMLDQASNNKKVTLRNVLEKLTSKTDEINEKVKGLQEEWKEIQDKTAAKKQSATAIFRDLKSLVDNLEKEVMVDISQQENWASQSVSDLIEQLQAKRDELAGKILHVQDLLNMEDPVTVLQELETRRNDFCDLKPIDDMDLKITYNKVYTANDLDDTPIVVRLQTLSDILKGLKCGFCINRPTEITLAEDNLCKCIKVSQEHLKTISSSSSYCDCYSFSCLYRLVLSTTSFSSGSHYWEVEFNGLGRVGVCYANIPCGNTEANDKSWWLKKDTELVSYTRNTYVTVIHNKFNCRLFNVSSPKIRIYLIYETGQISFYELCTPIRHLHTFTAKFTAPLHAAFYCSNGIFEMN